MFQALEVTMAATYIDGAGQFPKIRDCSDALPKLFTTALLLTADAAQAENAVLEAIRSTGPDHGGSAALLPATVAAAIRKHAIPQSPEAVKRRFSLLPWQLNAVIYLSPRLRHCFVLRVLLGWSRKVSARALQVEVGELDEHTRVAAARLVLIQHVFDPSRNRPPIVRPKEARREPGRK